MKKTSKNFSDFSKKIKPSAQGHRNTEYRNHEQTNPSQLSPTDSTLPLAEMAEGA